MRDGPSHQSLEPGMETVQYPPLIETNNIFSTSPTHKTWTHEKPRKSDGEIWSGIQIFNIKIPLLIDAKIKRGSFH